MRNKIYIIGIIFCLLFAYCDKHKVIKNNSIQHDSILNKRNNMKKLDIQKLEKYKKGDKYEYQEKDTLITIEKPGQDFDYFQSKKAAGKNFQNISVYDKATFNLKREGTTFFKMPIGIHVFYDENGKVTKEINFDEGYAITIDQIIEKMKKEFKIDLNQDEGLQISRDISKEENIPVYDIYIPTGKSDIENRHIRIDATTGKIIFDIIEIPQQ